MMFLLLCFAAMFGSLAQASIIDCGEKLASIISCGENVPCILAKTASAVIDCAVDICPWEYQHWPFLMRGTACDIYCLVNNCGKPHTALDALDGYNFTQGHTVPGSCRSGCFEQARSIIGCGSDDVCWKSKISTARDLNTGCDQCICDLQHAYSNTLKNADCAPVDTCYNMDAEECSAQPGCSWCNDMCVDGVYPGCRKTLFESCQASTSKCDHLTAEKCVHTPGCSFCGGCNYGCYGCVDGYVEGCIPGK